MPFDFSVTNDVINEISSRFNVPIEMVKKIHHFYKNTASKSTQHQYLAHTIRAMEDFLRGLPGNELFQITCRPVEGSGLNVGIAGACYYKNRCFIIYYHPGTDERQLRVMLAHELGHLFLVEIFNKQLGKDYNEKTQMEPISTVFGVFAILENNDVYYNNSKPFKHRSIKEALDDFSLCFKDSPNRKQ
jgi:Zn-dependent peptidase ImmA (M78 family)